MYLILCLILASWTFENHRIQGKNNSGLCSAWDSIEKNLKNEEFQLSCTKGKDCQSINCSGTVHDYFINSGLKLRSCENPPSIEFEANVPKLNVNNIVKTIYHNDSIIVTKSIHIEFEVQKKDQELVLGIFVHFFTNGSFPLLRSPRIPVFTHISFPINCSSANHGTESSVDHANSISAVTKHSTKSFLLVQPKNLQESSHNCSITNKSCGIDEMCLQINKTEPAGKCVCIPSYKRDKSGTCVYDPTVETTTEFSPDNPTPKKNSSSASLLLTAILVPISVILILIGMVYVSIRLRIYQRLRRRLRVQVYEHVLLGEDEDDEDLANPVA